MQEDADIVGWLEHLKEIFPPDGVLYVGAGAGTSPWIAALRRWGIHHVTLVEADESQFRYLQRAEEWGEGWSAMKQLVTPEPGSFECFGLSFRAESGLIDPAMLQELWPNVTCRSRKTRLGSPLSDVLQTMDRAPSWLVVDCLPADRILRGAGQALENVDVLIARAVVGAGLSPDLGHREALANGMGARGMRLVAWEKERHPAVGHALFVWDLQSSARGLRAETRRLRERVREARQTVAEVASASQTRIDFLEARLASTDRELRAAKDSAQQGAEAWSRNMKRLESELAERSASSIPPGSVAPDRPVSQGVTAVVVQLQAHMNLQRFLDGKLLLPDFYGWPISSDFGLHLVRTVMQGDYQVVIEFGSGASTLLVAHALARRARQTGKTPAFHVAFEHLEEYAAATESGLREHGLTGGATRVVRAPLVPFTDETGEYCFYDVRAEFEKLGGSAKGEVLVVVDGPPGGTCKKARYPAVPLVTRYFGTRAMRFLLDDYRREEEHAIGEDWCGLLEREGREFGRRTLGFHKGALEIWVGGLAL